MSLHINGEHASNRMSLIITMKMSVNVKYVSPHDGRFQYGVTEAQRRAWKSHRHLTIWLLQRYTHVRKAILINITERDKQNFDSPIEQPRGWCQFVCQYGKSAVDCFGTELHYCGLLR